MMIMKVSNVQNLLKALNENETEIELHGDFSESVIKAGLSSSVLYAAGMTAIIAFSASVILGILYLIIKIRFLMLASIVLVLACVFAGATLITMILTQKISLTLSMKLRKYSINKHNDLVVLKLKSDH